MYAARTVLLTFLRHQAAGLGQGDVFLQKMPISFDPSVQVHPDTALSVLSSVMQT